MYVKLRNMFLNVRNVSSISFDVKTDGNKAFIYARLKRDDGLLHEIYIDSCPNDYNVVAAKINALSDELRDQIENGGDIRVVY